MNIPCVYCNGIGENLTHIHSLGRPGAWRYLRCQACDGTGIISQMQHAAYSEGRRRRDRRLEAGLTQHQMATQLGVSTAEYSQMEHGRRPWPESSEAAFTMLEETTLCCHCGLANREPLHLAGRCTGSYHAGHRFEPTPSGMRDSGDTSFLTLGDMSGKEAKREGA